MAKGGGAAKGENSKKVAGNAKVRRVLRTMFD